MARKLASCKMLVATLFFAASGPVGAIAATVSNQGGDILISRGEGFVPVQALTELAPGGRVLVRPGGMATIAYANNCTVRVGSGIWMVQDKAPCSEGTTEIDFTGRMNQQGPPDGGFEPGFGVGAVLGIAAIVGLGTCLVSWCHHDHRPASP